MFYTSLLAQGTKYFSQ